MKDIFVRIKPHFISIALIIYGVLFVLNDETLSLEKTVVHFSILAGLALAVSLAIQFPKKERLIWVVFYLLFGFLIVFDTFHVSPPSPVEEKVDLGRIPEDTSPPIGKVPLKKATPAHSTEPNTDGQKRPSQQELPTDLEQQIVDIMKGDDFLKIMESGFETGEMPDILTSFTKFQNYLVLQGIEELENVVLDDMFQEAFLEFFPGQKPSDLDNEMQQRYILTILEFGYEEAPNEFLKVGENAVWLTARFDPTLDMGKALSKWTDRLLEDDFGSRTIVEVLTEDLIADPVERVNTPGIDSQEATQTTPVQPSIDRPQLENTPSENEKHAPPPFVENMKPVDITEIVPQLPEIPTEADLETSIRKRLTSDRLIRALETLNRYGPEEGLRQIKESDPETANIIQRFLDKPQGANQ